MSSKLALELLTAGLPSAVDGLIVGLGNPGPAYEQTRHNAGFLALEAWANRHSVNLKLFKKAKVKLGLLRFNGQTLILAEPWTFMNLSGQAVAPLMQVWDLPPERLTVLVDDVTLDFGRLRIREKGSSGGQNGLKSIISSLQNQQTFARLRLGVGPQPSGQPLEDFVLEPFTPSQWESLPALLNTACNGLECYLQQGITAAQQELNGLLGLEM